MWLQRPAELLMQPAITCCRACGPGVSGGLLRVSRLSRTRGCGGGARWCRLNRSGGRGGGAPCGAPCHPPAGVT
jgi:hypothetical protein